MQSYKIREPFQAWKSKKLSSINNFHMKIMIIFAFFFLSVLPIFVLDTRLFIWDTLGYMPFANIPFDHKLLKLGRILGYKWFLEIDDY